MLCPLNQSLLAQRELVPRYHGEEQNYQRGLAAPYLAWHCEAECFLVAPSGTS